MQEKNIESATIGGGCFWCMEAVFQRLRGVENVISGYSGGVITEPSYEQICSGQTGHAEVCRINFDRAMINYQTILNVFWRVHNPTTLNRQGNDIGTQYRSVVFYHNEDQRQIAEFWKERNEETGLYNHPIVTEISPLINFYPAEKYHQNYYNQNPQQSYCQIIIQPKLEKFLHEFADKIHESEN